MPPPSTTDVHALHDNIPVANDGLPSTNSPPMPKTPCPELLERLNDDQRISFFRLWDQLSLHLRDITFDLHGPGWSPSVITALGDVLCEFPDVFSKSKTNFGSCSLIPFKIPAHTASTPYSPNSPILHSTSIWPPASFSAQLPHTPGPWLPSPRKTATSG